MLTRIAGLGWGVNRHDGHEDEVGGSCARRATNYHNVTHPSLPNYIAATSGLSSTALHGFLPDCSPGGSCQTSARSIFGQGETWKSYEESMPSSCDHSNSGNYAVRHNPAAYYTTLHGCSSDDVSYSHLATDLAHNQLPAFSFITPNLIDDSHNGTVADADKWLSRNLSTILNSSEYRNGSTVIFITWDEGEGGHYAAGEKCATSTSDISCRIAAVEQAFSTDGTGPRSTRRSAWSSPKQSGSNQCGQLQSVISGASWPSSRV
jgi:phospholipase C